MSNVCIFRYNFYYKSKRASLDIRRWQCSHCGTIHDRDINAATKIRDEGVRLLAGGHLATASGERIRPSKGTAFVRSLLSERRILLP
ncbi:transposase [Microcoleus sp. LEGE 07076]|uniref:transposase n=1 Tax=Microcoleus sp. LEGE 07076 TaxID=915322 RepID=UPI001D14C9E2|nr:transposase [Microcoleus sp. LEGE 07076]